MFTGFQVNPQEECWRVARLIAYRTAAIWQSSFRSSLVLCEKVIVFRCLVLRNEPRDSSSHVLGQTPADAELCTFAYRVQHR